MVLLRFTKLLAKLFAGKKKQTIRKPRKIIRQDGVPPIVVGTRLDIYALMEVGTARVTKITEATPVGFIEDEEAIKDGFNNKEECIETLRQMHNCDSWQEFDIIEFETDWIPFYVIDQQTLSQLQHLARERDLVLTEKNIPGIYKKNQELQEILAKIKSLEITRIKEK